MNEISPQKKKEDPAAVPRILFIEGHSRLREVWAQLLDLAGDYEIDVARNGLEGVQKAITRQPDLILMGLRLPLLDGYETIRAIRSNPTTANTPIIVLSAWSSATHKQRALALGANEHITPPVDIDRLLGRIDSYFQQKFG